MLAIGRAHIAVLVPLVGMSLAGCQSVAVLSDPEAYADAGDVVGSALERAGGLLGGPDTSLANQKALGDRLAAQALERVQLAEDEALQSHLSRMAQRIATHAGAKGLKFRVYLYEDDTPNAFTPGGGHIFVATGLVARLKTESQMAMVLAHEIAHNVDAHVVKGAHRRAVSRKATEASKTVFDERLGLSWVGEKLGLAINATVNLYTRDQEDAADEDGLDYLIAAGYDPREAEATFQALMAASKQSPLELDAESAKDRRTARIRNLLRAKYAERDFSPAILSTPEYDRLAGRYHMLAPSPLGSQ